MWTIIALVLTLQGHSPISMMQRKLFKLIGIFLFAISFPLLICAILYFRSFEEITDKRIGYLVTTGSYKYVRHPQYTAMILMLKGLFLLIRSKIALVYAFISILGFYQAARFEEKVLLSKFGVKYEEYIKKVPGRFLPKKRKRLEG